MNFTSVTSPGRYRVIVEGVGSSPPFKIETDLFKIPFLYAAHAFYYQRNGVELQNNFDGFVYNRPATLHPDDVEIYWSTAKLAETSNSDIGVRFV